MKRKTPDQRTRADRAKAGKQRKPRPRGAKWDFADVFNVMSRVNRRMGTKHKANQRRAR
jgi:hypothetical protein